MMLRRSVPLLVVALVWTAACSKEPPPETPAPSMQPDTAGEGARRAAQMAEDSARRAREAEEAARRAATEETARARAVLEELVFFDYDESAIRSDAQEVLSRKVAVMRANPNVALQITGHADERGSIEYNLALGLRRANAVKEYMTGFGIDGSRLTTETMGEDQPLDPGHTEAAYARNRRGAFEITRGGDVLTMPGQ